MFELFKRAIRQQPAPRPVRTGSSKRRWARLDFADTVPLPQVIEGNEDTDWALWEDSVSSMERRLPRQLAGLASGDPFAKVGKNRDL